MLHKYYIYSLFLLVAASLAFSPSTQAARNVKLAWDPTADPDVTGYNLYYGTSPGAYSQSLNVGNSTSATVTGLNEGSTYFIIVTAYTATLQSLPSNEISFTVPQNVPPTVTLTSPLSGASFNANSSISLTASASDPDGSVTKVEFYEGSNKIGQATAAPYAATWSNAPSGSLSLTALAYDDSGAAVRSTAVPVTVSGSAQTPTTPTRGHRPRRMYVIAMTQRIRAGTTARFKIVASASDSSATAVSYNLEGTATSGVDYNPTSPTGQIVMPAGARTALLSLDTLPAPGGTRRKTATVGLIPGADYRVGQAKATVIIVNRP